MKNLKRILSVIIMAALLVSVCSSFYAYAAPSITKIEIIQEPAKKAFVQGVDWDYGEWYQPNDTGAWQWKEDTRISFLRNGGSGYYQDAGMIDATGLKIRVSYSDGKSAVMTYTESKKSDGTYAQNIIISPENGVYKAGKMNVEVWLEANYYVYDTYEIELLQRLMGDLTADGKLTSTDALKVLQYSVGLVSFSSSEKALADMNSDGYINSSDALIILQKVVGLIK